MIGRRLMAFGGCIAAFAAPCAVRVAHAQDSYAEQQVRDSVASFLSRYGKDAKGAWVSASFKTRHIYFADSVDSGVDDHDHVFLRRTMVPLVQQRDDVARFRALADLAATILHEETHLGQSHSSQGASRLRQLAGGDHPSEVEAWRSGFQAYRDFMQRQEVRLDAVTAQADREREAAKLRALLKSFEQYRVEYEAPGKHFGTMRFNDGVLLADEAERVRKRLKDMDALLGGADFTARIMPHKVVVRPGTQITLRATAQGGAFNPQTGRGNLSTYAFYWYAGGKKLLEEGPTLTRTVAQSGVVTVQAVDRLGAKSSEGTCEIIVDNSPTSAPATQAPKPAAATPPAAKPKQAPAAAPSPTTPALPERDANGAEIGYWVMEALPVYTRTSSGRVIKADASATGFRGTFRLFDNPPEEFWGTFTPPPGSVKPDERIRITGNTNFSLDAKATTYGLVNHAITFTKGEGPQVLDFPAPKWDANRLTFNVQVEVVVMDYWYAVWQYEYHWVRGRP